jgi:hypothetical protein
MIPSLTLFPVFVLTVVIFTYTVGIQTVNGSSNTTTTGIATPNSTLPGVDNSYQNEGEDIKAPAQNCQMPPCPPGEMCIQSCPESLQ